MDGDSPSAARRRVRIAIREAREAASLTQTQVAQAMEWSLSKVNRIESGDVSVSANDLRPLLGYLKIGGRPDGTHAATTAVVPAAEVPRAYE
jgi:transcriptional regulator with XRE-family HTH domain